MAAEIPPLPTSPWQRLPKALFVALLLAVIGLFVIESPSEMLDKAKFIGFGICHQMPERSFFIDGHQLPLCARCTGMYLGLVTGVIFLAIRGRTQAARLPPTPLIITLIGFIVIMGIDGVNSTISVIPGAPQLYHTTNLIRIIQETLPTEIYDLAAQSHVQVSFETPIRKWIRAGQQRQ